MTTKKTPNQLSERTRKARFNKWLETMPPEFLECRRVHLWQIEFIWKTETMVCQKRSCRRCGRTYKEIRSRRTDERLATYEDIYPTDYLKPPDATKGYVPRSVFLNKQIEQAPVKAPAVGRMTDRELEALNRASAKEEMSRVAKIEKRRERVARKVKVTDQKKKKGSK